MPNKYPTFGANYYSSLYSKYLPQYAGTEDEYAGQFDSWWENMYNKYQGDDQAGATYFESLSNSNINPFIHMDDTIYPPVNQPDTGNVTPDFWGEYPKILDYINKSWNEHGYNQYWNVNDYTDYLKNTMSGLGEKEIEKRLIDISRDENPFNEFVTNNWYNDETAWGRVYQSEWDKFSQLNANADIWSTAQAGGYTANKIFKDWFNTNVKQKYATDVSGYNPETWYSLQNINPYEVPVSDTDDGRRDWDRRDDPSDVVPDIDGDNDDGIPNAGTREDPHGGTGEGRRKDWRRDETDVNGGDKTGDTENGGETDDRDPTKRTPPKRKDVDVLDYIIAVPDELRNAAQYGYGSQWMRSAFEAAMSPNIQEYGNTVRSIQNSRGAGGLRSGFG